MQSPKPLAFMPKDSRYQEIAIRMIIFEEKKERQKKVKLYFIKGTMER